MIRRVRETVLAMVPLILGTLWTVAIMQLAGLKFNLVNVWALPLIIGSAAEYGVNIVLRSLESAHDGGPRLARSTVMGVVFNGLRPWPVSAACSSRIIGASGAWACCS
jgi:predicted RND superfamily exporter protein